VTAVETAPINDRETEFLMQVADGRMESVQAAVMRMAVERDLVVTGNRQESVDLESIFLNLVREERAA
jgi:hypothetical protein